jgi:IMP dehydrogenase
MDINQALTFDDVALVPQFNNVESRTQPSLETWLSKTTKIGIPILCANMDTTIGEEMADLLIKNGSLPIFHRFTSLEQQKKWVNKYKSNCYISCGVNNFENIEQLLELGARGVCIDIAHGHSEVMIKLIKKIKNQFPEKEVIAGNVCTATAVHDLYNAGADAIKCGVGPGSCCTTRMVTGFGVPQFSAILNCSKAAKKLKIPLIADGGIRNSRDMILALAAGASTVMMGGLFSKTIESPSEVIEKDGLIFKKYRGQASKDFQDDYYGQVKNGTVPEGVSFEVECSGSAKELIDEFCGGLRSGLTYGGSKSINELHNKAEFVHVTRNYLTESKPRTKISK